MEVSITRIYYESFAFKKILSSKPLFSLQNAVKLDGSTFKNRQLKVTHKRVNDPNYFNMNAGGRGAPGGRGGRGRGGRGFGRGGRGRFGGRGGGRGGRGGYQGRSYHPYY